MHILARALACSVLLAASTLAATDNATSAFEGSWKLNVARSRFNPGPPPREILRSYKVEGDTITMTIDGTRGDGSIIAARARFKLNGNDARYSGTASMDTVSVTSVDARTWNVTAKNKGKLLNQSIFLVSPDGKTLTQTLKGRNFSGELVDDVLVYERQ